MWKCYFLEVPPQGSFEVEGKTHYYVDTKELKVGAMWYPRDGDWQILTGEKLREWHLTKHYWTQNAPNRPPLVVLLPYMYGDGAGTGTFSIDSQCYDDKCTQCSRRSHDHWDYTQRVEPNQSYPLTFGHSPTPRGHYDGWTVSGEPPNITVSPSINIFGSYHGWLQNGVVSQDVDGRNYTLPT